MLLYAEGAVIRPLSVPLADLGDVDRSPLLDCFFLLPFQTKFLNF